MPQWDDPKPGYKWPVAVAQLIAAPGEKVWESNLDAGQPRALSSLLCKEPCAGLARRRVPG